MSTAIALMYQCRVWFDCQHNNNQPSLYQSPPKVPSWDQPTCPNLANTSSFCRVSTRIHPCCKYRPILPFASNLTCFLCEKAKPPPTNIFLSPFFPWLFVSLEAPLRPSWHTWTKIYFDSNVALHCLLPCYISLDLNKNVGTSKHQKIWIDGFWC